MFFRNTTRSPYFTNNVSLKKVRFIQTLSGQVKVRCGRSCGRRGGATEQEKMFRRGAAGGAGEVQAELRQKGRCNGAGEDGREDVQARRGGRSSRGSGAARRAEQERFRGDASGAGEFMGGG